MPLDLPSLPGLPSLTARVPARKRKEPQGDTTLLETDEQSLLASLGSATMSGLGYLGGSLDKALGGRAIRGLLDNLTGGDTPWSELASIIPFSDTLGITNPENVAEGRDILENLGAPTNKPGFSPIDDPVDALWDTAGFASEVLLDPGTYASLGAGAVGKGGALLKKVGKLPKGVVARQTGTLGKELAEGGAKLTSDVANAARATGQADLANVLGRAKQEFGPVTQEMASAGKEMPMHLDPHALLDEPLGGLIGFGKPTLLGMFGVDVTPAKILGTGPMAQKVGGVLDRAGDYALYSRPGRAASKLFDTSVRGAYDETLQREYRKIHPAMQAVMPEVKARIAGWERTLYNALPDITPDEVRILLEGQDDLLPDLIRNNPAAQAVVKDVHAYQDDLLGRLKAQGVKVEGLVDEAGVRRIPRFLSGMTRSGLSQRADDLKGWYGGTATLKNVVKDPYLINPNVSEFEAWKHASRKHKMDTVPGREAETLTSNINQKKIQRQAILNQFPTTNVPPQMQGELDLLDEELRGMKSQRRMLNREHNSKVSRAIKLPRHDLEPWQIEMGGFGNDPFQDLLSGSVASERRVIQAKSDLDVLADAAKTMDETFAMEAGAGRAGNYTSVRDVLRGGADDEVRVENLNRNLGISEEGIIDREVSLLDRLSKKDPNLRTAVNRFKTAGADAELTKKLNEAISRLRVPRELANEMVALQKTASGPEVSGGILKFYDMMATLFKTHTLNWPSRYSRDFMSAGIHNFLTGNATIRDFTDTLALMQGKAIASATEIPSVVAELKRRGMDVTPENATNLIREWFAVHDVATGSQGVMGTGNLVGVPMGVEAKTKRVMSEMPGLTPESYGQKAKRIGRRAFGRDAKGQKLPKEKVSWNPLKVRGGFERDSAGNLRQLEDHKFPFAAAGDEIGMEVEAVNRGTPFLNGLRKGMTPQQAAANTAALQVDYRGSAYTKFERDVMLRAMPFYKYTRKIVPAILKELATRPGGGLGVTIRGINEAQEGQFVPEYLQGQLAIPLGETDAGTQRYLTSLGLPIEQLNLFHAGEGGLKKTGLDMLGMGNPLLKGLLEEATGRQFYSDRDLRDLDPRSGRILSNLGILDDPKQFPREVDQLLLNSPAARYLSAAGQITDSRKGVGAKAVNLLTGARISDVDMEKQREIETRKLIDELLRGQPGVMSYERLFVPEDKMELLSDKEKALYAYSQRMAKRASAKKRAEKARVE